MADINVIVLPDGTEYPVSDYYLPVAISNPTAGQVLKYDATNQVWYNGDDAEGSSVFYGTSAPASQLGVDGNLYVKYTEGTGGASDTVDALYVKLDSAWCEISTGGGGTTDYSDLTNKPQINSVELSGNKSLDDLGIQPSEISKTATGSIVTFSDGGDNIPVESFECDINPVQDLHGYDHPWPAGCGKNELDAQVRASATSNGITSEVKSNNLLVASGESTGNGDMPIYANNFPILKANQTYTISLNGTDSRTASLNIFFYMQGVGFTVPISMPANKHFVTYTPTTDSTVVQILFRMANGGTLTINANVQIEKGSTASAYEPYENICPISGHSQADIPVCGKNLLDIAHVTSNSNAQYKAFGSLISTNIPDGSLFLPQGTYTFSVSTIMELLNVRDDNGDLITSATSTNSLTFTLSKTTKLKISLSKTNGDWSNYTYQLEKSNQATTYEPYTGTLYSIAFGQTIYGGRLIYANGKWAIEATHGYVDLGSLNWSGLSRDRWNTTELIGNIKAPPTNSRVANIICSALASKSADDTYLQNEGISVQTTGDTTIYLTALVGKTSSEVQTALSGVQLVYELTTPLLIPLASTAKIKTLSGVNNIFSNTGDSTLKYFTNDADEIAELVKTEMASTNEGYHEYSTEEKIVGKWIDGKTLYEKTIDNTYGTDLSNIDIEEIVGYDAGGTMALRNNGTHMPCGTIISGNAQYSFCFTFSKDSNNNWSIDLRNTSGIVLSWWRITIRYTKISSNTRSLNLSKGSSDETKSEEPVEEKKSEEPVEEKKSEELTEDKES